MNMRLGIEIYYGINYGIRNFGNKKGLKHLPKSQFLLVKLIRVEPSTYALRINNVEMGIALYPKIHLSSINKGYVRGYVNRQDTKKGYDSCHNPLFLLVSRVGIEPTTT